MTAPVVAGYTLLGLAIGSFLNVVIHRLPLHQSVVTPSSHCPRCETPLRGRDNVPVASWVVLRGRCRHCAQPISARYPLVEVGTAAMFAALAVRLGPSWVLPAYAVCFAWLLALSLIHLDHGLLPARILHAALVCSGALLVVAAWAEHRWGDLGRAAVAAGAAAGSVGLLRLVHPGGIGSGDVRLSLLVGAHLGFLGSLHLVVGIVAAGLLRAATGLVARATGRRDATGPIPLGPFLALGGLVAVLFG